jgi:hypothetical protein
MYPWIMDIPRGFAKNHVVMQLGPKQTNLPLRVNPGYTQKLSFENITKTMPTGPQGLLISLGYNLRFKTTRYLAGLRKTTWFC